MANLPVEVVEEIFKYLTSLEDRKSASLVCHQWYRAYMHSYFRKFEIVTIVADKHFLSLSELENFHRKYLNIVLKNVDVTDASIPFWERFGRFIETLSFHDCYVREKMFIKVLSHCVKIESLTVHNCKELLMAGLILEDIEDRRMLKKAFVNLKVLNLSFNRYLSDAILMKLLALCPNVTTLILTGCQISYHNGMFRKYYPNGLKTPSENVTTFQMILRYVSLNAKRIKHISLGETFIDSDSLNNLSLTEKLELGILQLRSCTQISNTGLIQLCTNLNTLTELDVGHCPRITDTSFIVLCGSLPLLSKLSVVGCRALTDMGLCNVWQLEQLKELNVSECDQLQGTGIVRGLCYKVNTKILSLNMGNLGNLTESAVISISESLPNLRFLDLTCCFNAVTDMAIQSLFQNALWLRILILHKCDRVSDCGITGMGVSEVSEPSTHSQLLRVPLGSKVEQEILRDAQVKQEVRELCENELLRSDNSGFTLSNLKGLQLLNLGGCNRISDVSLKYAFKLMELKSLNLSYCQQITTEGLSYLVENCPAIEYLDLDYCQNVDDEGVEVLVCGLTRLKSLILGSNKVTDTISLHIQNNAVQLTYIDLRHCGRITGPGVGHLFHSLPFLQTFHYPENPVISRPAPPPPPFFRRWFKKS